MTIGTHNELHYDVYVPRVHWAFDTRCGYENKIKYVTKKNLHRRRVVF